MERPSESGCDLPQRGLGSYPFQFVAGRICHFLVYRCIRFTGFKPPVRKISECSTDAYTGVAEKTTGKRGLVFRESPRTR